MASAVERIQVSGARMPAGLPRFAARVAATWLALVLSLLVMTPALAGLFGSARLERAAGAQQSAPQARLDRAERLVVAQLDDVRSDLLLIGATSAVSRYLSVDGADDAGVSNDLREFAATRDWCRRVLLAVAGRAPVIAERASEQPACGPLLEVAAGLSPGTLLLDRVSAPAGPGVRLCFALPLEARAAGAAVLVAEVDPAVLFADVTALSGVDGSPSLADGHGRWLLEPPFPAVPLVRRGIGLSSWQGPAGGRWEIAVPGSDPARDASSPAPARQETAVIVALAGFAALVIVQARGWRQRQHAWIEPTASSSGEEVR